jgi:hypothetical protein
VKNWIAGAVMVFAGCAGSTSRPVDALDARGSDLALPDVRFVETVTDVVEPTDMPAPLDQRDATIPDGVDAVDATAADVSDLSAPDLSDASSADASDAIAPDSTPEVLPFDPTLPNPVDLDDDPLLRMPGTQHTEGFKLDEAASCLTCHGEGLNDGVEVGSAWAGGMMAQAARDPIFLATFTVALQDSRWVLGNYNAGDLCLRCHFPAGWVAGRSDPPNGTAMTGADHDGVSCDTCHRQIDPHFVATYNGEREGNDWLNIWDETNASGTPSQAAADATLAADKAESLAFKLFNGNPFFGEDFKPAMAPWIEAGSGQYFYAQDDARRASFADADATHEIAYSRFHKSRYMCGSCHDVSNPALANLGQAGTAPGDGETLLVTEAQPAHAYAPVERTFSEFMLSKYGQNGGAEGSGIFAPDTFKTSLPGNKIGRCQDCHMADLTGKGAILLFSVLRPDESAEHPNSGMPNHDMVGGNVFVSTLLASTDPQSPNYDETNANLLGQGPDKLLLDLNAGTGVNGKALLAGAARAQAMLEAAGSIADVAYDEATGALSFKVVNHTGHKLISGFAEGRRMFLNVRLFDGETVLHEINPYDAEVGTLKGLHHDYSPWSPDLDENQTHASELVYEMHPSSALTGEEETFHFVLGTGSHKDNRIPPPGFNIEQADERKALPFWEGQAAPDYFTADEYAGGYDKVELTLPAGGDRVEIRLYYQTASREYIEFLRDEITGDADTLASPTPSGAEEAYVVQKDPYLASLKAWGDTIWQLWQHNKDMPGAAPLLMVEEVVTF